MSNVVQFPSRVAQPQAAEPAAAIEPGLAGPVPMMVEAGVSAVGLLQALVKGGFTVSFDPRERYLIVRQRRQ